MHLALKAFAGFLKKIYLFFAELLGVFSPALLAAVLVLGFTLHSCNTSYNSTLQLKDKTILTLEENYSKLDLRFKELKLQKETSEAVMDDNAKAKTENADELCSTLQVLSKYPKPKSTPAPVGSAGKPSEAVPTTDPNAAVLNQRLPNDILEKLGYRPSP